MEHLKLMTYTQDWGSFAIDMVAIFDDRNISEDKVNRQILAGEESPAVIICTNEQFEKVFSKVFKEIKELKEQVR